MTETRTTRSHRSRGAVPLTPPNCAPSVTGDPDLDAAYRAVQKTPDEAAAHHHLARLLALRGEGELAAHQFRICLALDPGHVQAGVDLAEILRLQGRPDEAETQLRHVLDWSPDSTEALSVLGWFLHGRGRVCEAVGLLERAVSQAPDCAPLHTRLATALGRQGRTREALAACERALALDPEQAAARYQRGYLRLLLGDYTEGWPDYAWRHRCGLAPPLPEYPLPGEPWTGQNLTGRTILVYGEQGLGDIVQCLRFLPELKGRGARVVVEVPAALERLVATCPAVDAVHVTGPGDPPPEAADYHLSFLDLPGSLGTTLETLPPLEGLLQIPGRWVHTWHQRLPAAAARVGLVWAGNPRHPEDAQRSCPLAELAPLAAVPGLTWISLQRGPAATQREPLAWPPHELGPALTDLADTAAVLRGLDLVITVDTAIAHLAGVLGRPVWILLPAVCDWRWLLDRADSPWYPTARLFRQDRPGDWAGVVDRLRRALTEPNAEPQALLRRAVAAYGAGRYELAETLCREARAAGGDGLAHLHTVHGVVLEALGRAAEAVEAQRRAVALRPDYTEAWVNLAMSLQLTGDLSGAVTACARALELDPRAAAAHYTLGSCHLARDHHDAAVAALRESLRLQPDQADAHNQLGMALAGRGDTEAAIAAYREALGRDPERAEFHNNLGIALRQAGRLDAAVASYGRALRRDPGSAVTHYNLANALQEQGRLGTALEHFDRAVALDPDYADAHWNRALCHLLAGDFAAGWRDYPWRHRTALAPGLYPHAYTAPRWDGRPFPGRRLLVHSEQGLGDTLQFVRYLPRVKALGGTVLLETWPELLPLLEGMAGIDTLRATGPAPLASEHFDLRVSIMDLPGLFGDTPATLPASAPYLQADPQRLAAWRRRLRGPELRVGLVWAGRPTHGNDRNRSCPLAAFAPLWSVPGVRFYGLQKGPAAAQAEALPADTPYEALGDDLATWGDTAAAVMALDLVLSVDTAVAHLAGALGQATWILLPFAPDWRWLRDRVDSPWYPTARLLRQPTPGDWDRVLRHAARLLGRVPHRSPVTSPTPREDSAP